MFKAIAKGGSALVTAAFLATTGLAASACAVYETYPAYGQHHYRQGHGYGPGPSFKFRYENRDYGHGRGGRGWR
jgi:hypothetical protein